MWPLWACPSLRLHISHPDSLSSRIAGHKPHGNQLLGLLTLENTNTISHHAPIYWISISQGRVWKSAWLQGITVLREVWEMSFWQHQPADVSCTFYVLSPTNCPSNQALLCLEFPPPAPVPSLTLPGWLLLLPQRMSLGYLLTLWELPSWRWLPGSHAALGTNYMRALTIIVVTSICLHQQIPSLNIALCLLHVSLGCPAQCWRGFRC